MKRQHIVVTYDIRNPKRLRKVARIAEDFGERVQFSVFDCFLDRASFLKMKGQLQAAMDLERDKIRFYRLCGACHDRVEVIGCGVIHSDDEVVIV